MSVKAGGLHPLQACLAWHLRKEEEYSWEQVADNVKTVDGRRPLKHALRNAVERVEAQQEESVPGRTRYANCGRHPKLTEEQIRQAVDFVKKWRHKRFCTCRYIISELKLPVKKRRLAIILNQHGFFWKKVPKTMRLSEKELQQRKDWVNKYVDKSRRGGRRI